MKEFEVTITETLCTSVTVTAEDENEALDMVHDMYENEEIVLDASDYSGTDFDVSEVKD